MPRWPPEKLVYATNLIKRRKKVGEFIGGGNENLEKRQRQTKQELSVSSFR